ncbi:hypothetical protein L1987_06975 [Smallanthus sonchifolius]|uniref:Uncharacterized protein n=1 Tax=Smallanthus sonchifolius TaxID=185202 RepID=A0ACB9JZV6_9ASTR|nr:hypothetical protein L1987_06975 [Smallanthus sonchifolius]
MVLWCVDLDLENPNLDLEMRQNLDLEMVSPPRSLTRLLPVCYAGDGSCVTERNTERGRDREKERKIER